SIQTGVPGGTIPTRVSRAMSQDAPALISGESIPMSLTVRGPRSDRTTPVSPSTTSVRTTGPRTSARDSRAGAVATGSAQVTRAAIATTRARFVTLASTAIYA